jgi:hypothetical protein
LGSGSPVWAVALLWGFHHPPLAWWLALVTLLLLALVAGYRLQRRLLLTRADEGFLDALGRQLFFGEYELDRIANAGREYIKIVGDAKAGAPLSDDEMEKLNEAMATVMEKPEEIEWANKVVAALNAKLPHHYSSRFRSVSGLTPADPPAKIREDDYWRDRWSEQEKRLQRLHQIIEELNAEVRKRWS